MWPAGWSEADARQRRWVGLEFLPHGRLSLNRRAPLMWSRCRESGGGRRWSRCWTWEPRGSGRVAQVYAEPRRSATTHLASQSRDGLFTLEVSDCCLQIRTEIAFACIPVACVSESGMVRAIAPVGLPKMSDSLAFGPITPASKPDATAATGEEAMQWHTATVATLDAVETLLDQAERDGYHQHELTVLAPNVFVVRWR